MVLTTRADGDARPLALGGTDATSLLHKSICDAPWSFVHQVHGKRVVALREPAAEFADADALVTAAPDVPLAVLGADCALIAMVADNGVLAAVHAGWRGLVAGVVDETASVLRRGGGRQISAVVSASIHAECYPFSGDDLDTMAVAFGDGVRAHAQDGTDALDLVRAVEIALARAGVAVAARVDSCTACGDDWYSHRARRDRARHALVIWRQRSDA